LTKYISITPVNDDVFLTQNGT